MNRCMIIGNLTRDPELRSIPSTGTSVCNFTVAVSRRFSNQAGEREADFIPVVVWRGQAESCARYLRKGSQVAVAGSIQTRSYDAKDGTRRYITEVVADEVQFIARTAGSEGADDSMPMTGGGFRASDMPPAMQDMDDDLPF